MRTEKALSAKECTVSRIYTMASWFWSCLAVALLVISILVVPEQALADGGTDQSPAQKSPCGGTNGGVNTCVNACPTFPFNPCGGSNTGCNSGLIGCTVCNCVNSAGPNTQCGCY